MKAITVTLLTIFASYSYAHDAEKISQLESDIAALKQRVIQLESIRTTSAPEVEGAYQSENWKNINNWRSLKTGMSPDQVRELLGEPETVDGGMIAKWQYINAGTVFFYQDKLDRWNEPKFKAQR